MKHIHTHSKYSGNGLLALLLACAFLLAPASALAYGDGGGGSSGGGGGGGGSIGSSIGGMGGGPDFQGVPSGFDGFPGEIGIEGVMVEPAPGSNGYGGYYDNTGRPVSNPGPTDTPWYNTPEYQFVEKIVTDKAKDKVLDMVLATNPELLAIVKTLDAANGVYQFSKEAKAKLDKAKKDYQKALMGTLGSNLQAPPSEIPTLTSYQPGGGPAPLHDNNFLQ